MHKRILILNWRSIKDHLAGGAELATFEHAKRWVKNYNASVTWVSPVYALNIKDEVVEGISFKYLGIPLKRDYIFQMIVGFTYFYILVFVEYFKNFRGNVDVVIDQVHGVPYMTSLYVKEKIIVYIHEVAGDIWDKMYKFPVNKIGKFVEHFIFKLYRNTKFVAGSQSTKNDLIKLKIKNDLISVVGYGISINPLKHIKPKENVFTILFLNRLVKMKGPERAIKLFSEVKKINPDSKLWIAGHGDEAYINYLKDLAENLGIQKDVTFFGFVSEAKKIDLLQKAHVLINTSYKEGWGLVNIEANSQATPVVAFDVAGNVDSVKQCISGFLAKNESEFIEKVLYLSKHNLAVQALEYSKQFDWDKKAKEFWNVINN